MLTGGHHVAGPTRPQRQPTSTQPSTFYTKLFGTEPAKRQPGYANFAIAEPPLKLVLMEDPTARGHGMIGALNHLGVEVEIDRGGGCSNRRLVDGDSRPRSKGRRPAATPCRTRSGSTTPTAPRGRSTPSLPTPRRRDWALPETQRAAFPTCGRGCLQRGHAGSARRAAERARSAGSELDEVSTDLWRRLLAEFLGSGLLVAAVIGSGIAAQKLSPGDIGLQLFENAAATAAGLFAIILMFGPISGAHFNPVVSFVDTFFGGSQPRTPPPTSWSRWPGARRGHRSPTPCSPRPPSRSRPSTGPLGRTGSPKSSPPWA